jgi:hypothetical protein
MFPRTVDLTTKSFDTHQLECNVERRLFRTQLFLAHKLIINRGDLLAWLPQRSGDLFVQLCLNKLAVHTNTTTSGGKSHQAITVKWGKKKFVTLVKLFETAVCLWWTKKTQQSHPPCFDYSGKFGRVIVRLHRVISHVMFICVRQKCVCAASIWKFCMHSWKTHLRVISLVMHN